ncbi:hypothetical protein ACSBL2_24715 [Pedobacter sp. AW31-3R]|uniref:hypothetical protein n=1 Tax=Pedobacter sp. AW31-3R TaxID=3445781 RepID=UPI003F9F7B46
MQKERQTVKSFFFKNFFVLCLVILGLTSLCLLLDHHQSEFTVSVLEVTFMFYAVASYLWTRGTDSPLMITIRWSSFFYVVISYVYAVVYKERNVLDFIMIYKCFFYLFFLTFLSGKTLIAFKTTNWMFIILLGLFILKYVALIVIMKEDRPTLYMENNFELMLIYALFLVRYSATKGKYLHFLGLVGLITILSLSRASLLMYSVIVLFVIYDSFKKTRVFFIPGAIMVLGAVVYYIFTQRDANLEEVDRYKFMLVWWSNIHDWNILQWLVGAERITPLSAYSCRVMGYFVNLFSYAHDGSCYSVVLHSFLFRIIYDHGLLGLVFVVGSTWALMAKNKVAPKIILVFITIVLINGLSVSSFNNLFFAISMVFLMTTNMEFPKEEEAQEQIEEKETEGEAATALR